MSDIRSEPLDKCSTLKTDRSNSLSGSQTLCPMKLTSDGLGRRFGTLPRSLLQKQDSQSADDALNELKVTRSAKMVDFPVPSSKCVALDENIQQPELMSRV